MTLSNVAHVARRGVVLLSLGIAPLRATHAQSARPIVRLLRAENLASARARLKAGDSSLAPLL